MVAATSCPTVWLSMPRTSSALTSTRSLPLARTALPWGHCCSWGPHGEGSAVTLSWLAPSASQDSVICQWARVAAPHPVWFYPFLYPRMKDSHPVVLLNQLQSSKSLKKKVYFNLIRDVPFCQSALLIGLSLHMLACGGCQQSHPEYWFMWTSSSQVKVGPCEIFRITTGPSVQFISVTQLCLTLCDPMHTNLPCPSTILGACSNSYLLSQWCHLTIPSSVIPFSSCFNLSQHQGLFQWISSSHQVPKVLELQFQYQSFQWIFRADFLYDWLIWYPFSPRNSQESSPTPQFKIINSLALSFLYGPTLTFIHNTEKTITT